MVTAQIQKNAIEISKLTKAIDILYLRLFGSRAIEQQLSDLLNVEVDLVTSMWSTR